MQHEEMAVRKYYGHCQTPTREVGYTRILEFINRIRQVKIIAINIFFVKKNRKQCRSIRVPPWKAFAYHYRCLYHSLGTTGL